MQTLIAQQQTLAARPVPPSPPAPAPAESKVVRLFRFAEAEIGKRYAGPIIGEPDSYRWGSPGWDCSSFVTGMYRAAFGIPFDYPFAYTDSIYGHTVPANPPHTGDVIFYEYDDAQAARFPHMGIYVDAQTVLDARFGTGKGVGYHSHVAGAIRHVRRARGFSWDDPADTNGEPDWRAETRAAASKHGIDPAIFERQIQQESGFAPDVIHCQRDSSAGARGIAQLMPVHWSAVDPCDPAAALDYAARLMAGHLQRYGGDWRVALAAYNAGPGAVAKYGGVPPFEETRRYIEIILG